MIREVEPGQFLVSRELIVMLLYDRYAAVFPAYDTIGLYFVMHSAILFRGLLPHNAFPSQMVVAIRRHRNQFQCIC